VSKESVEIVRRMFDAWNQRDLETVRQITAPGIEYVNSPTAVEPGTRHGHDGLTGVFEAQWEILADGRTEVDGILDRGDEIIALIRLSRRMPGSDTRLEVPTLLSCEIRDRLMVRIEVLAIDSGEIDTALRRKGVEPSAIGWS
jgi:ketosteroid isomerase-like protein